MTTPSGPAWRKSSHSGNQGGNCIEAAVLWRKSTYSGNQGGACVETAVLPSGHGQWRKSSHSGNQGGECVETAALGHAIGVRDSKDTDRGHLALSSASWSALMDSIKR
ncbi:DUF397 domain-containing protein [Uniformispora flossi]|uniref:DUF397 domain-containing protein n=1 Tax=Uniformispora flossi TaxID=3390723 RepID=UPI003C2E9013